MPNTEDAAQSQTQHHHARPSLAHRHSSTSSHASSSLSEASGPPTQAQHPRVQSSHQLHHGHKRHVVGGGGHGRLGARNLSSGKNLNKLAKLASAMPHDGHADNFGATPNTPSSSGRHLRKKSGDSIPQSPRPGALKRNASAFVVPRNPSHTALKKNFSSGHLPAHKTQSSKGQNRTSRPGLNRAKSSGKSSGKSDRSVPASPTSPLQHPTVRFALGDDVPDLDDEDNEWTEESASVSPNLTRDNTRQNSVILDPNMDPHHDVTSGEESTKSTNTVVHAPVKSPYEAAPESSSSNNTRVDTLSGATLFTGATNGAGSQHQLQERSHNPDADAITSRLLQRRAPASQSAQPQITEVSAIVHSGSHDSRSLSHSQVSTLGEGTPGRDLVSRFVNANSADGTPKDDELLDSRELPRDGGEINASKRNKSAPNFADRGPISPTTSGTKAASRRSGTNAPTELPPSRTQQKLLLQRASSAIEPQKHVPAVLPRPGASHLLGNGVSFTTVEGGMPAQIQGLFAQINKEYNVVRRYRSPISDAVARQKQIPHPERRPMSRRSTRMLEENGVSLDSQHSQVNDFAHQSELGHEHWGEHRHEERSEASGHYHPHRSSKHSHQLSRADVSTPTGSKKEDQSRKSRVSFDLPNAKGVEDSEDDDDESSAKVGSVGTQRTLRERNEAYEICRRMWDMGEAAEVKG